MQLTALSLLAVVTVHPDLVRDFDLEVLKVPQPITGLLETSSVASSKHESIRVWWLSRKNWSEDDKFVCVLMAGGCIISTILLIYGAIKGRAGHMVPFMGLQVFDFCITSLTVISYFSYVPDVKLWISVQENFPLKDQLMKIDADWLMLAVVLSLVAVLVMKAYLIGIVWSCYKYLTQQQRLLRCDFLESLSHPQDSEVLLPPKYDDVVLLPPVSDSPPPPPYTN
jgi:lysosomal-associated transmembrane protein